MRFSIASIVIVACVSSHQTAFGAVTEYTDGQRNQWFTDVGGVSNVSTVDFTGYPDFTPVSEQWSHLGIHFSGFVVTSGFDDFFYHDGWGARGEPDINLTFDEPIEWIAADFPGDVTFELYLNGQLFHSFESPPLGGVGRFAGLISDQPFDEVRIFDPADQLVFLDDLHFGPPIAVPGPGALAPLGLIVFFRRRQR